MLKLNDYTLPPWLLLTAHPWAHRSDSEPRAFSHGSIITSDKMIDEREITLSGRTYGYKTRADHDVAVRELQAKLSAGGKLYVDGDRYINIDTVDIDHSYEEGMGRRMSTVEVTCLCADPFWYSKNGTTVSKTVTVATQWTINNPGIDVYPVITVTAAATVETLTIKNTSDNNRAITYADPQLINGVSVVFDCIKGTVLRDASNAINNLSGGFVRLLPGDNVIDLTAGSYTVQVAYTERWI